MQVKILEMMRVKNAKFVYFEHEASGPSLLSAEVRARHGYPGVVGAKALVLSVKLSESNKKNVLCVVHSHKKLDKVKLKNALPEMKSFRFLTAEELFNLTVLVPGSVPPFGKPILNVDMFLLDKDLELEKQIGFNCASLTHSVVMDFTEYLKIVNPDIFTELGE